MKRIIFSLLAGAAIFAASCSKEHQSASLASNGGSSVETHEPVTIRVMTYNVHHCNPPSKPGFIDVGAIVNTIRAQDPDLLALQEIDVNTTRSGAFNQAEEIAEKLHMNFFFGKAIDYQGGEYGVAILSKYPLSETVVNHLPTKAETKGEPRVLATAKVALPDGSHIRFGSTHLDAQKDAVNRQMQIEEIGTIAYSEKLPFIIAGDFNAVPGTGVIKHLDKHFTRTCQPCDPTIPVDNPDKAIDFIAYTPDKKFKVISNEVIAEKYASDHLPVVAEINFLPYR